MSNKRKERKEVKIKIGGSIISIVTIIFVLSKVSEIGICKDWDWIWVFSPLWFPLVFVVALLVAIVAAMGLLYVAIAGLEWLLNRRRSRKLSESGHGNTYGPNYFNPGKRF